MAAERGIISVDEEEFVVCQECGEPIQHHKFVSLWYLPDYDAVRVTHMECDLHTEAEKFFVSTLFVNRKFAECEHAL